MLPVRAFLLALLATVLIWGRFLLPTITLSPEAQIATVHPGCRAGTAQLKCQAKFAVLNSLDPHAPAWQEGPANYFFRRARSRGEPKPSWNPYVGSGYLIALDAINAPTSPTRWFLSVFPGDHGRDVLVFLRFLLWTFGIVWAVGLCGAGVFLLVGVAAAAVVAPYAAAHVETVFLDVDLLGPWFLLILVAFIIGRLSFASAAGLSVAVGAVVGAMGFPQSQIVLCAAIGLLGLAAAPFTRGRSLALAACFGAGEVAMVPAWLPLVRNLDQFVSSRDVVCVIEKGFGAANFWHGLLHTPAQHVGATLTLVGTGLLLFVPGRWWFVVPTLAAMGLWIVLGLPHAACSLPVVAGARFGRHLIAHFEMLFLFAVGVAVQRISERVDGKRARVAWALFVAACVASLAVAAEAEASLRARMFACSIAGAVFGLVSASVRKVPVVRRGLFAMALVLFAFPPYFLGSLMPGARGARELAPLPVDLDPSTPLGAVQYRSEHEDRRHFSPGGFLYPNWSAAFGILDVLTIGAFYPVGYHELNSTLFRNWPHDPQHGIVPDRFVPIPISAAVTLEFQRVMAVNRVSLLTFGLRQAAFAEAPSPYEASKCQLLARSTTQGTESYVCPAVGGVGYFPEVVRVVSSRAEALNVLQMTSPADIIRLALLGPELGLSAADHSLGGAAPAAGRVVSVRRSGDDLTYVLEVDRAGIFVVADTYFRGWHATVNGAPSGISRANVAFKAVSVPKGTVNLALHFSPALF